VREGFPALADNGERKFSEAENITRLALYRDAPVQFVGCFDGSALLFLSVPDV
jgi:hypothetical protein